MKRALILGSIVVAIATAAAGCGKKQAVKTVAAADPIPNVIVSKVSRSSFAETFEATGTVNAKTTTQISANLLGRINAITVNEGDAVKKAADDAGWRRITATPLATNDLSRRPGPQPSFQQQDQPVGGKSGLPNRLDF